MRSSFAHKKRKKMFEKDKSLNEQRLDCVIKSMALTAHYIGGADKNFDQKKKSKLKRSVCF